MKILVVKPTALGDVAQALLVAPLLREMPGCTELVWLVDEDYQSLVRCSPLVDRVILFPRKRWRGRWWRGDCLEWLRSLRREKFDLVLDLQGLARSALMTWATGAPKRWGLASAREFSLLAYTDVVGDTEEHAVDRYAQAVAVVSNRTYPLEHTYLKAKEGDLPSGLLSQRYTVLHPYSLWPGKLWGWQNFERLALALPEETFVLVGQGSFFPVLAPNCIDLRNTTTLDRLLMILSKARVVISTDSGPLHLAAAFGRPVLGLYGPTSIEKTGARSREGIMLQGTSSMVKSSHREKYPTGIQVDIGLDQVIENWQKLAVIDQKQPNF